jgi:hypothetical protein
LEVRRHAGFPADLCEIFGRPDVDLESAGAQIGSINLAPTAPGGIKKHRFVHSSSVKIECAHQ